MIANAEKVVIFGGEGTRHARAEVLELSHKLQAPVGYAFRGKDVLEADNPNAVGMTGLLGWGGATEALGDADLVLMLGTDFFYHAFLPAHPTIIQVDDNASHLGRRASVDLGLTGDVGETLRALLPRLQPRTDSSFLDKILKHHHKDVEHLQTYVNHDGQRRGPPTRDGRHRAQRSRRRRRGVLDRHRHVQRVGCPLPAHEARPPPARLVRPRLDGQRHAAGDRCQGRLPRPAGHRPVRRRRVLDADGRDPHRRRPRHPRQADGVQQLHARHGPRRDDGRRLPTMGHRRQEPRLRGASPPPPVCTANASCIRTTSAPRSSGPSNTTALR